MAGDGAVHAHRPVRRSSQGRPHHPVGHPARHQVRLPLEGLPERVRPHTTVYNRFNRWARRRFRTGMLEALAKAGWSGEAAALDSTYVRAQRAAHGGKGGPRTGHRPFAGGSDNQDPRPHRCDRPPRHHPPHPRQRQRREDRPRRAWTRRPAACAGSSPTRATTPTGCSRTCASRASASSFPAPAPASARSGWTSNGIGIAGGSRRWSAASRISAASPHVQVPDHREQRFHQDRGSRPGIANRQVQRSANLLSLVAVGCGGVVRLGMEGPCRRVGRAIRSRFRSTPRPSRIRPIPRNQFNVRRRQIPTPFSRSPPDSARCQSGGCQIPAIALAAPNVP